MTAHGPPPTDVRSPITGATQLFGLIGWPVGHSFSPAMHNAALAERGINGVYVPLPVHPDHLPTAVAGLAALGFGGVNVTVPHKQAVMPLLDTLEESARAIGAVNTLVFDHQTTGHNTDWSGFLADLAALQVPADGRDCLVLGAGGSARAVVYALARAGGRVQVLARRPEQAADLAAGLRPFVVSELRAWPLADLPAVAARAEAPLIINTTPLGMAPHVEASIWPAGCPFPAGAFVYDLVYNPRQTRLMQQAQQAGCGAANGLGMLVHQGADAFTLWTGQAPDVELMRHCIA